MLPIQLKRIIDAMVMTDNTLLSDRRLKCREVPKKVLTLEKTCPPMVVATLEMACRHLGNRLRIEGGLRAVVGVLREIGTRRVVGVPPLVVSQEISQVTDIDQTETNNPRTITDIMIIIPEHTLNRSK